VDSIAKTPSLRCGLDFAKAVAKSELKLDLPSHATFYRFLERMREEDAALRLAKATQVSREVASIARTADIADNDLISSLQSLGAEAALNGNVKDATRLVMMACDIARKTAKSEELRIANEKLKMLQEEKSALKKVVDGAKKKGGITAETLRKIEEAAGLL